MEPSPEKVLLLDLMRREHVSKSELARRLGKSRQTVTECLKANVNRSMLLDDLEDYAAALGYSITITAKKGN